jgi:hypothetical protein
MYLHLTDFKPDCYFGEGQELRTRQAHGSFRSLRPDESSSLQPLGKQAQAVSVEPEKLDHVASAPAKDEHVAGERLLLKHRLHLRTQAVETTSQIRHTGGNPDPRPRAKLDHLRKLSSTARNSVASAPHSTLIVARPGSSM